jgi:hypothetical protein
MVVGISMSAGSPVTVTDGCRTFIMRSYKSYFVLILVPYIFLIFMFHTQLQLYDTAHARSSDETELLSGLGAGLHADTGYHVRDLRINNRTLQQHESRLQRRQHPGLQSNTDNQPDLSWKPPHVQNKFSRRKNLSHDIRGQSGIHGRQVNAQRHRNHEEGPGPAGDSHYNLPPWESVKVNLDSKGLTFNGSFPHIPPSQSPQSSYSGAQQPRCRDITGAIESNSVTFQTTALGNYIYTAFYDERKGPATVRIIALIRKADKPAFFCHFKTDKNSDPSSIKSYASTMATYYEMCENHGKDFGGWMLSCEVPSEITDPPCEVHLSLHSAYDVRLPGPVIKIPVILLQNKLIKKQEFALCVPPLFGYIPSTTLIEFIELTKILGANHFIFYAHQVPREIQKVLRYYERIGVVTVIPWDLPVQDKQIWYHGQLLAINDCLYRNMHRFQYLAFNDIDEFIVPHKHNNWTEMVQHILAQSQTETAKHAGYSFQSAFFDPLIDTTSRVLYDLESDLRTKSFSKVRTKVMVNAERIHELGIHHISKPVRDNVKPVYIEPEVAFLHHYRKCVTDFDPRMNCQVFARDESISRYIPTLRHNVHQTLWILKETEKLTYRDKYMRR